MKSVTTIQWVRGGNALSPIRPESSRQAGSKPACALVRGRMEPGVASMQAVLLSPEIFEIVVRRITSVEAGRKADAFVIAEGSSPDRVKAIRQGTTGV